MKLIQECSLLASVKGKPYILPSFVLSASEWIESTNAIGIVVRKGRYGGTYINRIPIIPPALCERPQEAGGFHFKERLAAGVRTGRAPCPGGAWLLFGAGNGEFRPGVAGFSIFIPTFATCKTGNIGQTCRNNPF